MSASSTEAPSPRIDRRKTRIWDLPTRLFHWTLAGLLVLSFVTAKVGGNAMQWHFLSGYAVLTLLVFRLLWGFAGDRYARFSHFDAGLRAARAYLQGRAQLYPGHNPLGAWSVVAMLASLGVQAITGLFANDAIFTEGPLAKLVSAATSDRLTSIHHANEKVLIALVTLHIGAVSYYLLRRRDNLIVPMFTGDKAGVAAPPATDDARVRLRAVLLLALSALLVAYVVNL